MASSIPASVPVDAVALDAPAVRGGAGARRTRRLVIAGGCFVLALALIYWLSTSSSNSGTVKIAAPVDSVEKATKRLAILKNAAATVSGRQAVLKQASDELASREKGLVPGDTPEQAQAQLLQVLKRVARQQSPPLDIRQVLAGYGERHAAL